VPTIQFSLNNPNGINPNFYRIVVKHFNRLDLLHRYTERFNSVYHQTFTSFRGKGRFAGHPNRVRDFLLDDANTLFQDYGRNYHVGVIKEALANSAIFLNQF